MGYQNNSRPDAAKLSRLAFDALFDLSDLKQDVKQELSREQLIASIEFIKTTVHILAIELQHKDL